MTESWSIKRDEEDVVDDLVMHGAYVHFEDLGDSYMLIVQNEEQRLHLTIPAHKKHKAWLMEIGR